MGLKMTHRCNIMSGRELKPPGEETLAWKSDPDHAAFSILLYFYCLFTAPQLLRGRSELAEEQPVRW